MAVEQNERAVDRGARALNARDWETYARLFADSLVTRAPGLPGPVKGRDARVKYVQQIVEAFPDGRAETVRSFGQGDWLCVELVWTGTHKGPMAAPDGKTIPPTNKSLRLPYVLVMKFEGGVVTELDEYFDQVEILTQLGLMS